MKHYLGLTIQRHIIRFVPNVPDDESSIDPEHFEPQLGSLGWLDAVIDRISNELWCDDEFSDVPGPLRLLAQKVAAGNGHKLCGRLSDLCFDIPRFMCQLAADPEQLLDSSVGRGAQRAAAQLFREYANEVGVNSELGVLAYEISRRIRQAEMRAACCIVKSAWTEFCAICDDEGNMTDAELAEHHYFNQLRGYITPSVNRFVRHTSTASPGDPILLKFFLIKKNLPKVSDNDERLRHRSRILFLLSRIQTTINFAAAHLLTKYDPKDKLLPGASTKQSGRISYKATGGDGNYGAD